MVPFSGIKNGIHPYFNFYLLRAVLQNPSGELSLFMQLGVMQLWYRFIGCNSVKFIIYVKFSDSFETERVGL